MKKLIYTVFGLLALSLIIAGCSGDSYEKRLKNEKRAIKNYIADNEIKVIYEHPQGHNYDKDAFYLDDSTGIYWRIIEKGEIDNPLTSTDNEEVYVYFDSVTYLVDGKTYQGNNYPGLTALKFTYNIPGTYIQNNYNADPMSFTYLSAACVLPLRKGLGSGAVVDMIVPFVNGSAYQKSKYEPFKYTRMTYLYNKPKMEK